MPVQEYLSICDVLRDLESFVQFKKRKKHAWRSVSFCKVVDLKSNTTPWAFSRF